MMTYNFNEATNMENKRSNFKRISENRVSKIVFLINQLSNLKNTSFYEYTDEQIEKMFEEIEEATKRSKKILLNAADRKHFKKEI
jgi:hypothetical protein